MTLKDDWVSDMQKKALILESHHSTHIEGTAISLEQAQDILSGKKVSGVSGDYQKVTSCIRRTAQRDLDNLVEKKVIKGVAQSQTDATKYYVLL